MPNLSSLNTLIASATCVVWFGAAVGAQTPAQRPAPSRPVAIGEITGRLTDSSSGRAVTSGSITVRRAGDSSFAGGALPKDDGSFRVDGLAPGRYTLRVRAIGYGPYDRSDIAITAEQPSVNVGSIGLKVVAAKLDATTTVAEREDVVIAPDRTTYNVKNMPVASGGTAVDVLRNIPLVEVDGSNNVSLRGNANVVIQINGRSTPLKGDQLAAFLAQLPSATVKNVEVATNPSAKDDPEGTAGIINIVLNQDAEVGLSGGINASAGSTGGLSGGANLGKQQGKLIVFVSGNIYREHRDMSGSISRTYLALPTPAATNTALDGTQSPVSGGGNLRSEYRFTPTISLSFDAYAFSGKFDGDNASRYLDFDAAGAVIGSFDQFQRQTSTFRSQDYDLTFRKVGKMNAPVFSTDFEISSNNSDADNNLSGVVNQADPATPSSIRTERDRSVQKSPYANWKTDYTHQFGTTTKLETGFKITSRTQESTFDAAYRDDGTGVYASDPARATDFDYREDIGGAYGLVSNKVGKWQTQGGLRLEDAASYFTLNNVGERFTRRYASAYPSAIVSYNFTDLRQAKISYSRRVSRPSPFQLNPIEMRQDTRNVFRGNPDLRAEYTDAIELGYQETRSWGTVQLSPYLRSTAHAVRNIQFVDSTGVSVSTYDNVASTRTIGGDLNVNAHHGPLLIGGGGSVYHYSSDASNIAKDFSARAMVWSARTNATWRFGKKADAQAFVYYRGPYATEGGSQLAAVSMTLAARYKLWGDQGNIALRVSDPFKLQRYGYRTANGTVFEYSERFFGSRAVYLTISRNFGQPLKLQPRQQDPDAASQPTPGTPP
jgi:outer membrane receptor protein involved in Fe transport